MNFRESFTLVFREHFNYYSQIIHMAFKDIKKQYSGTFLGALWPMIKNCIFVFAYWFTISVGLKGSSSVEYPYMAWLTVGLVPWFFIRDTLVPSAKSIRSNKYLVTKMIYPVSTIPTFKVISGFISSFMFLIIMFLICAIYKIYPSLYWIQIIYYAFAAIMLLIAISFTTSALVVVSRDVEFFLNSIIVLIFWISPILWPISNLSGNLAFIVKLNPFFYIIEGFRESILSHVWFWQSPALSIYFWTVVLILFIIGIFIHGKLRNYFADIL
ncbi:MAG: ABC transporter permease [Peptostreptococcaceae bacterium]|nr:ABC transporter permease [Peptostreptococcaceae bacterium]